MKQVGNIVFWDQKFIKADQAFVSVWTQSLQFGNSVFEGIRSYDTAAGPRLFKAREHYKRFLHSSKSVGLNVNYSLEQLIELSYELLKKNGFTDAFVKPLLISDPGTNLMERMIRKVTEETNLITIKTRMERKGRERSQVVEMEVIAALVTALMTAQAQMCQYVKNKKKRWAAYLGLWSLGFSRRREWLYLGTTLRLGSKSTPRGSPQSRDHPGEIIKVQ